MNDVPLLRIGEFSRACSISVKSLRAYHEAGLLVPSAVDRATGYRSYSVDQLTDAGVIRRLRDLDLPLESVREVLVARDPEVTAKVLAEHGAVLEERIARMRRAVDDVYAGVASPALHTPVHERSERALTVLAIGTIVEPDSWLDRLAQARETLFGAAAASDAVVAGPFGACYPPMLTDDAQELDAFVPIAEPVLLTARYRSAGVRVDALPACDVATLAHHGSYDDLPDAYERLGAWVATHAAARDLPVREHYLAGPADHDDESAWRTELCWPVRGRSNP